MTPATAAAASPQHCAVLLRDRNIEPILIMQEMNRLLSISEKLYSPTNHLQDVFREKLSNSWRVKRLMAKTNLHDLRNPMIAEYFAKKMLSYIAGEKVTVDDYIFLNKDMRARNHFEQTALEQVLQTGLLTWARQQSLPREHWYSATKRGLWIVFNSRLISWFKSFSNERITASLLMDILENGFDAKSAEFQSYMKGQSKRDKVNLILRLLMPIVAITLFIYGYQEEEERKSVESAKALREAQTQLQAAGDAIKQIGEMYSPDVELDRMVQDTIQGWKDKGLPPAKPEDIVELRQYLQKQRQADLNTAHETD